MISHVGMSTRSHIPMHHASMGGNCSKSVGGKEGAPPEGMQGMYGKKHEGRWGMMEHAYQMMLNHMDYILQKAGLDEETATGLQERIQETVAKGADVHQVMAAQMPIIYQAMKEGVENPDQLVEPVVQALEEIEGELAAAKFEEISTQLSELGVDEQILNQVLQNIDQLVENGADANLVADEMLQILPHADEQDSRNVEQVLDAMTSRLEQIADEISDE